jgi:hypothetical protein
MEIQGLLSLVSLGATELQTAHKLTIISISTQ